MAGTFRMGNLLIPTLDKHCAMMIFYQYARNAKKRKEHSNDYSRETWGAMGDGE